VVAVHDAAAVAIGRARGGAGPTLLIADTWRYLGHMVGDTEIYRTADDAQPWRAKDPIARLHERLVDAGVAAESDLQRAGERALAAVESAELAARGAAPPPAPFAFTDVYAEVAS
jgi:TPP-dependent pyruvate/acetoin dehydrogenase alpha subunit